MILLLYQLSYAAMEGEESLQHGALVVNEPHCKAHPTVFTAPLSAVAASPPTPPSSACLSMTKRLLGREKENGPGFALAGAVVGRKD